MDTAGDTRPTTASSGPNAIADKPLPEELSRKTNGVDDGISSKQLLGETAVDERAIQRTLKLLMKLWRNEVELCSVMWCKAYALRLFFFCELTLSNPER